MSFDIPELLDLETPEQGSVSLTVSDLDNSFMTYDHSNNKIVFSQITDQQAGIYTLKFILEDKNGLT